MRQADPDMAPGCVIKSSPGIFLICKILKNKNLNMVEWQVNAKSKDNTLYRRYENKKGK